MTFTLCQLAGDFRGDLPGGGAMTEEKKDGWRAVYLPDHLGKRGLWTRGGMPIEGAPHILHRLSLMEQVAGCAMVFDGEFQVDGTLAATKEWCERGWKQGGEAGHLFLFDCLTLAEWRAGGSETPLIERKAMLQRLFDGAEDPALSWEWRPGSRGRDEGANPVSVLPDGWAFTADDVETEARRVWAAGGEGLMLKDPLSPYQRKRNGHWLKVKQCNAHKWLRRAAA